MKKSVAIVAGIVIVGGGLWLGGAWYTGTKIEARSPEYVARLNSHLAKSIPGGGLKLNQLSFERGLLTSQARYALVFDEQSGEPPVTLEFTTRYEHGPFPAGALSRGTLTPTMTFARSELARTADVEKWFKATQGETPMWTETLVSYDGDADLKGRLAPAKVAEDKTTMDFSGADLQGSYLRASKHAKGTFNAASLTGEDLDKAASKFKFDLRGTQISFDTKEGRFGMHMGDAELRIDHMSVGGPDQSSSFSVDKLVYGATSSEDDRFVKGQVYLRNDALTVAGIALGKQNLTVKMDNLDGAALQRVMDGFDKLAASSATGVIDDQQAAALFTENAGALLSGNPVLAIEPLVWTTDKGESKLDFRLSFAQPENLNAPAAMIAAQAIKSLGVDLKLHKPMTIDLAAKMLQMEGGMDAETATAMAGQQFDEMAARLIEVGFAKEDGDAIVSKIEYTGDKITVNGRDVPMSEIMGLMLAF